MNGTSSEDLEGAAGIPNVAPPPPEVKIRTMKSDIESMAHLGGGAPQFRSVKAPQLVAAASEEEPVPEEKIRLKPSLVVALVSIVAFVVLAAVAYMAYNMFFAGGGNVSTAPAPTATRGNNQTQQPYATTQPSANFTHATLFTRPVDQTLTFALSSAAQNASELQTFSQRFSGIFPGANAASTFFEVDVENADGSGADVNSIFAAADAAVLDSQYVLAHFSPDVTVFAYKDAKGIWPGYIFKLKPTENWLFLKDDVAKIEAMTAKIENFFLNSPGNPSAGGFKDDSIDNSPFRALAFSRPGATFVYGWYRGYLVFSTSVDGLKEAMARL